MYAHLACFGHSAFGVCPLAFGRFDSNKGQMSPNPTPHKACRVSHLVATKIIHGLYMAIMSHLVTQEE